MEKNKIYLDKEELVRIDFSGHLTYDDVKQLLRKVEELAARSGEPLKILCDMSGLESDSVGARIATAEAAKSPAWAKIAFTGADKFLRITIGWIIKGAGVEPRAQCFDSEKEAKTWLRS